MENLKIVFEDKKCIAKLSGEIDIENSDEFFLEMEKLFPKLNELLFDCESLEFIDSTAIGCFVKINKLVKNENKKFIMINLKPNLKKLFVICCLDKVIDIK